MATQLTPHKTQPDTYYVKADKVGCDGGAKDTNGALGHPLVYLELDDNGQVVCPYCSRKFIHKN